MVFLLFHTCSVKFMDPKERGGHGGTKSTSSEPGDLPMLVLDEVQGLPASPSKTVPPTTCLLHSDCRQNPEKNLGSKASGSQISTLVLQRWEGPSRHPSQRLVFQGDKLSEWGWQL